MKNSIVLLDGAIGTSLWEFCDKYGYEKIPVYNYGIEKPELVNELTEKYINYGSKLLLTNTFGVNRLVLKKSKYSVEQAIRTNIKLVKNHTYNKDLKTVFSIGPLSMLLEPYGDLSYEEATNIYEEIIDAGIKENPDIIYFQTFIDLEMLKIAINVATKYNLPIFTSMSFQKTGYTIMGNSVEDYAYAMDALNIETIGLNCSLGPKLAVDVMKRFIPFNNHKLLFKPNAGLPISNSNGEIISNYSPEMFVKEIEPALDYVDYIGGCCGCNPEYIKQLKALIDSKK